MSPLERGHQYDVQPVQPVVAVVALAHMPGQDAVALPLIRCLREGAATGQPASAYIEPVGSNAPRRNFGHCSSSIPTGTIVAPPAETDQGEIAALGEASRGPLLLRARFSSETQAPSCVTRR